MTNTAEFGGRGTAFGTPVVSELDPLNAYLAPVSVVFAPERQSPTAVIMFLVLAQGMA